MTVDAVVRSFLVECQGNLGVLALANLQGGKVKQQDLAYLEIVQRLRSNVRWLILGVDDLAGKVVKELGNMQIAMPEEPDELPSSGRSSLSAQLWRLAVAGNSVTVAAEILLAQRKHGEEARGLKAVKIRQRLSNISDAYRCIVLTIHRDKKWGHLLRQGKSPVVDTNYPALLKIRRIVKYAIVTALTNVASY